MRNAQNGLLLVTIALLLCACGSPKYVAVFVDVSGSSKKNAGLFVEELQVLQDNLNPGDKFLVAKISGQSLTEFRPIINHELPAFRFWQDNTRKHNEDLANARSTIASQLDRFFTDTRWSSNTDILNTMTLVRKLFADSERRNILVIMSDMIEDSPSYNFEITKLTAERIDEIINQQKERGLLPDLSGVTIFISGATAPTADKAHEIEAFWRAYFTATRASLPENQYSPTLLVIPE